MTTAAAVFVEVVDADDRVRVSRKDTVQLGLVRDDVVHARQRLQRPLHVPHQTVSSPYFCAARLEDLFEDAEHAVPVEVAVLEIRVLPASTPRAGRSVDPRRRRCPPRGSAATWSSCCALVDDMKELLPSIDTLLEEGHEHRFCSSFEWKNAQMWRVFLRVRPASRTGPVRSGFGIGGT